MRSWRYPGPCICPMDRVCRVRAYQSLACIQQIECGCSRLMTLSRSASIMESSEVGSSDNVQSCVIIPYRNYLIRTPPCQSCFSRKMRFGKVPVSTIRSKHGRIASESELSNTFRSELSKIWASTCRLISVTTITAVRRRGQFWVCRILSKS